MLPRATVLGLALVTLLAASAAPRAATPDPIGAALTAALAGLDSSALATGILHDRVLPLAEIERFDGAAGAPAAGARAWRQAVHELRRAANDPARFPDREAIERSERAVRTGGAIPLALLDVAYERLRDDALARGAVVVREGRLAPGAGAALETRRVVLAAALRGSTRRGAGTRFVIPSDLAIAGSLARLDVDLDDGRGWREARLDQPIPARWATSGPKTLRVRLTRADGSVAHAAAAFDVRALVTPTPDDTLHVTASVPHQGVAGSGRAYVYLAPGHAAITNPVVVVEGFDLDDTMDWDELYALLDQQGLLETLRAEGFDTIVLDFASATDPIQRNGLVAATLIEQVQQALPPTGTLAVVGASMGGLCSRYALLWLESHGGHRVRTWISVDAPHGGADIPLGIQHWVAFFAGQSADAAFMRDRLNTPAARQMLLYHATDPPTLGADPLRAALLADFAALGDQPSQLRRVAMANGSGARTSQGFAPAAQIVRYEYSSFLASIRGNVWAVPDGVSATIFQGRIRILLSEQTQTVTVSTTLPWDGAPGGWRATMADMDASAVPYGDIVALHPSHCFIPTVSALALVGTDPFFDVAGDPALLDHTPFDAVLFPAVNEEHVSLSAAEAAWLASEVRRGTASVEPVASRLPLLSAAPNPFHDHARIRFRLTHPGRARLEVLALDGRRIATLTDGELAAGAHDVAWDGRDERRAVAPPGVYWIRLDAPAVRRDVRIVRLR